MKDCNNCRFHEQGKHPKDVVVSDPNREPKITCADCLAKTLTTGEDPLPFWSPAANVKPAAGTVKPISVAFDTECEARMRLSPNVPKGGIRATGDDMKKDAGKVGLQLLPFEALEEIAKVLDFGAQKYAAHKWRDGMKWSRLLGALLRHTFAWARGQDTDPETGRSHLAHAGCCVVFLLAYTLNPKRYSDLDDRVSC